MSVLCHQGIEFWGVVGTWFTGLGTFLAVAVALWVAFRAKKVKLKCSVGLRTVMHGRSRTPCVVFSVTNLGEGPVVVDGIGWVIGRGKKKIMAEHMLGEIPSDRFPKKLNYGERGSFRVELSGRRTDWLQDFVEGVIKQHHLSSLRAQIYTSVGHTEKVRPEMSFLKALEDVRNTQADAV